EDAGEGLRRIRIPGRSFPAEGHAGPRDRAGGHGVTRMPLGIQDVRPPVVAGAAGPGPRAVRARTGVTDPGYSVPGSQDVRPPVVAGAAGPGPQGVRARTGVTDPGYSVRGSQDAHLPVVAGAAGPGPQGVRAPTGVTDPGYSVRGSQDAHLPIVAGAAGPGPQGVRARTGVTDPGYKRRCCTWMTILSVLLLCCIPAAQAQDLTAIVSDEPLPGATGGSLTVQVEAGRRARSFHVTFERDGAWYTYFNGSRWTKPVQVTEADPFRSG